MLWTSPFCLTTQKLLKMEKHYFFTLTILQKRFVFEKKTKAQREENFHTVTPTGKIMIRTAHIAITMNKRTFVDVGRQTAYKHFPGKPFAAFRSLTVGWRPRRRRQCLYGWIDQMRTRVVQQSRLIFERLKEWRFTCGQQCGHHQSYVWRCNTRTKQTATTWSGGEADKLPRGRISGDAAHTRVNPRNPIGARQRTSSRAKY